MRVVFVGIGSEQLGIELLSSILKREGHHVSLVYYPSLFNDRFQMSIPPLARWFEDDQGVVDRIAAERPDVIAMSVLSSTYQWCLSIARAARARAGAPVIFGGVHPSAVPEVVIREGCVDAVCIGEGDQALPRYLSALERGDFSSPIPNLWRKTAEGAIVKGPLLPFEQDLDSLPFFDKALYADEFSIRDSYLTMTGRGCPYRCTFCFNNFWAKIPSREGVRGGRYVRQRSVDNVIRELVEAKRRWKMRHVAFLDDVLPVDKDWLGPFLSRYREEIKLPFLCLTHPNYMDEDIVRWLKAAGCEWVQIGIQSVDEHYKHATMKRYEKAGDLSWSIDALNRAGIKIKGDHILGSPGEELEAQEAARIFYSAHAPSWITTYWMTYLPGVEMTGEALRQGRLTQQDLRAIDQGLFPSFHERDHKMDPENLRALANYEALFHTLTLLPKMLRPRVQARWFNAVPRPLLKAYVIAVDLLVVLYNRNPEFSHYVRYNFFQILKHLRRAAAPRQRIDLARRNPMPPPRVSGTSARR